MDNQLIETQTREEKALKLLESVESGKVVIVLPVQIGELVAKSHKLEAENLQFKQDLYGLIQIFPVIISEFKEIGIDGLKKALPDGLLSKLSRRVAKQSLGGLFNGSKSQTLLTPEEINEVIQSVISYVMQEKPRLAYISKDVLGLINTYAEKLGIDVSIIKKIDG